MKKIAIAIVLITGVIIGYFLPKNFLSFPNKFYSPLPISPTPIPRPLLKYSFTNLKQQTFSPQKFELVKILSDENDFTSWLFLIPTDEGKVSGQINLPRNNEPNFANLPVVIMLRGYVEKEQYQTGVGTKNAAKFFAQNGFITVAPDFLGYGDSDPESMDEMEARLIRPATVMQILASLPNLELADPNNVFMWGHSNGGQIALSVLEISEKKIPTVLWAPVSKPFPYSILYYTDDSPDLGKYLRNSIADFEKLYDVNQFSISNYFDWINAPIQVHQGTTDDAVPWKWSKDLVDNLKKYDKEVILYTYPGADHNLKPNWNTVVSRNLEFFKSY